MADLRAALKLLKGAGITIPKKEFVKEHKKLVGVLTKGTKKQRLAEAKDQAKELAMKGGAMRVVSGGAGDTWFVEEDGRNIAGPFRSREEAQQELNRLEGAESPPPQQREIKPTPAAPKKRPIQRLPRDYEIEEAEIDDGELVYVIRQPDGEFVKEGENTIVFETEREAREYLLEHLQTITDKRRKTGKGLNLRQLKAFSKEESALEDAGDADGLLRLYRKMFNSIPTAELEQMLTDDEVIRLNDMLDERVSLSIPFFTEMLAKISPVKPKSRKKTFAPTQGKGKHSPLARSLGRIDSLLPMVAHASQGATNPNFSPQDRQIAAQDYQTLRQMVEGEESKLARRFEGREGRPPRGKREVGPSPLRTEKKMEGEGMKGGSLAMSALGGIMGILAPYLPSDPTKAAVEFALKQLLGLVGFKMPPESLTGLILNVVKPIVLPYLGRAAKSVFEEITQFVKELVMGHKKGGSRNSGFIQRMMAEVKLKHDGEYKNPTAPLAADSEMNAPVAFDYFAMPSESRAMSKFIMDHFFKIRPYRAGEREQLNEYELKKLRDAEAERQRRSRARRRGVQGGAMSGGRTQDEVRASLKAFLEDLKGEIDDGEEDLDDLSNRLGEYLNENEEEDKLYTQIVEHLSDEEKGVFPDEVFNVLDNIDIILTPRRR